MGNQFKLIPYYRGGKATIYTVLRKGEAVSPTEKFFSTFTLLYSKDIRFLADLLFVQIANRHGADPAFFSRNEYEVDALPPRPGSQVGGQLFTLTQSQLRLYVLRLNNHIVVVFGGEQKLGPKTQDNPALMYHWNEACGMAQAIRQALFVTPLSSSDSILPIQRHLSYAPTDYR